MCVCEQEAACESCHWYTYNLPSNQDELAHQSTPAQAYMEAVCKDMKVDQVEAFLVMVHESSVSKCSCKYISLQLLSSPCLCHFTYPLVVVNFIPHATKELLYHWHMAELILYYEAILISLWFSCGHNTQLTASSAVTMKHILWCFSDRASWIDYILITNFCALLLFIHKILISSTCFEPQVLIFRRIQLYTCSIWYCHSLWVHGGL